jgi:GGDEF domain-containing protein
MPASHLGRRRSRPVADAPALDGADLAKAWLVELVAVAPLERAARLPGPRFAEDAPRLCAAVVAALSSDAALEDLEPGGALAPLAAGSGHLAAAPGALEAIDALEALRAVVWAAVLEALDRPSPAQVAELSDRLATIITTLTTAALESPHPLGPVRPGDRGPLAVVLREAREDDPAVVDAGTARERGSAAAADHPRRRRSDRADEAPGADADERAEAGPAGTGPAAGPSPEPGEPRDPGSGPALPRVEDRRAAARSEAAPAAPGDDAPRVEDLGRAAPRETVGPAADLARRPGEAEPERRPRLRPVPAGERAPSAAEALAQIEATLRDAAHAADPLAEAAERLRALARPGAPTADPFDAAATRLRTEAPPAGEPRIRRMPAVEDATEFAGARVTPWAASIERRLVRHRSDGLPFAVLCLELADADRLVAADLDRDVVEAVERAEAAILAQLRPADALIRERPGRYWLTTPDTDASDARSLAHRIAAAVEDLPPHRGAPWQVFVGVATCPADGEDAAALESGAEEALFAARAGGQRVAGPPRD